ncbi:MAG: repair protein RecO, repair protein RecO [Candidatus Parcubacteria bacterium]|nr:repair protein RecO, repair protein RecO [Candidatus Parcubacteria bacterium]
MYSIQTTPGFIIDSRPSGEAGKLLSIFTRDLGLIMVIAQGIRFEKSKLRYHVQNHSFATFSLVRGKEFWRLTSASENGGFKESVAGREADVLIAKIAALLKRLLQGEDPHPELFELVYSCAAFLHGTPELSDEEFKSLESLTVLRMLHSLGYVGSDAQFVAYISSADLNRPLLQELVPIRLLANRHINQAIQESHL